MQRSRKYPKKDYNIAKKRGHQYVLKGKMDAIIVYFCQIYVKQYGITNEITKKHHSSIG
jgi:hypothetical protein